MQAYETKVNENVFSCKCPIYFSNLVACCALWVEG